MYSLALAVAVLTAPVDAPVDVPCSYAALQTVAECMELFDPRERLYVFRWHFDLVPDVKLVRQRYEWLADAPPACDALRFPERSVIQDCLQANRQQRAAWIDRQEWTREDWLQPAIDCCDWCYRVYDYARDARCDFYYVHVRRAALKSLREAIGPELYYAGCLPPYLPAHYLLRVD